METSNPIWAICCARIETTPQRSSGSNSLVYLWARPDQTAAPDRCESIQSIIDQSQHWKLSKDETYCWFNMILMTWIAQYELCIALVRWMGTILILLDFMSLVFTYKEGKGSMSVRTYVPRCPSFSSLGEHKGSIFKPFQIGQRMRVRQGVGLLALLAVLTKGEDYGYASRSEPNI